MYYNTMVALPMSLSLIKDRLEQGYYRQVQGVMGDVATIEGNATAFNGEDSQVADSAAGTAHAHLHLSMLACIRLFSLAKAQTQFTPKLKHVCTTLLCHTCNYAMHIHQQGSLLKHASASNTVWHTTAVLKQQHRTGVC